MYKPRYLRNWALVLLGAGLCLAEGSALAQNPQAEATANPNAQRPVKMVTNPNIQRRQNAMDELAAAVDARTQTDPQYKKYVESVIKHNNDMDAAIKAKKGGLK